MIGHQQQETQLEGARREREGQAGRQVLVWER
jgi:hypothetical protein